MISYQLLLYQPKYNRQGGQSNGLGAKGQMKKEPAALVPIHEFLLAKWVEAAEFANVLVTHDVLRAQAEVIQTKLIDISCEEDYTGFALSPGWLQKFRTRSMIGRLKQYGEFGSTNAKAIQNTGEEI